MIKRGRLIAIGDIHACYDELMALMKKIQLKPNDTLILLGDMIDKGKNTKAVIDFIINLKQQAYPIIPLMGNHERMLLDALFDKGQLAKWLSQGGKETLASFKINTLDELNEKYIQFFSQLPYFYTSGKYIFVHAGLNDTIPNPLTDTQTMIWHCKEYYQNKSLQDKIIIHGHCPVSINKSLALIHKEAKVINIDTGCVYRKHDTGLSAYLIYEKQLITIK